MCGCNQTHAHTHSLSLYIYIYIHRERERERELFRRLWDSICFLRRKGRVIDRFIDLLLHLHVNTSGVILNLESRELRKLYIYIYIFYRCLTIVFFFVVFFIYLFFFSWPTVKWFLCNCEIFLTLLKKLSLVLPLRVRVSLGVIIMKEYSLPHYF